MTVDLASAQLPARHVLIGVAGSIASVTVPQSILWLRHELGVEVRVVMTRQATTMVTPRAIAVASGVAVALDDTGEPGDHNDPTVHHMELTRWADLMLVLPASANLLAKAAHGIADDLLTTCIIASSCPVVFVPGMNEIMWRKPAVQRNVATLEADGYGVIAPVEGVAMCDGRPTVGAMPEIDEIVAWAARFLNERRLATVLPASDLPTPDVLAADLLAGQVSGASELAR
jgi:phosphopantothenoylcysteine decarboxylase/phosphopantothenate--cysteine ligase